MIIVMKPKAADKNIKAVTQYIEANGLTAHLSQGEQVTIIGVVGDKSRLSTENIALLADVDRIVPVTESYKLANLKFHPEPSVVKVGCTSIGPNTRTIMAGPCAVESNDQLMLIAEAVKKNGATILRGGAYKPRTSPYSFQGLEEEGLKYMQEAGKAFDLATICEVVSLEAIEAAVKYVDMIQIGARNMQNFILLRGIRTYETSTRNTLDLSAVPVLKERTHLPVIVDPSHATGAYRYVPPMAKAAVACGADGLMIEVHNNPACALSDGPQSLNFEKFARLSKELDPFWKLAGRN